MTWWRFRAVCGRANFMQIPVRTVSESNTFIIKLQMVTKAGCFKKTSKSLPSTKTFGPKYFLELSQTDTKTMKTSQKRQNLRVGQAKTEIRSYEISLGCPAIREQMESNPVRELGTRTDGG